MIILDLSEYTGKRPTTWPDDIPKKIRLVEGKHAKEYNIHPTHRRTKWYKKLVKNRFYTSPLPFLPPLPEDWRYSGSSFPSFPDEEDASALAF